MDIEIVGATNHPNPFAHETIQKISASKAGMRGALPKRGHATASRLGSEEPRAEDAHELSGEGAGASAGRAEGEAALGLMRMGTVGSPLLMPQSQAPVVPLKLSFVARRSGG